MAGKTKDNCSTPVDISGVARRPNQQVINLLKEALALAEGGEIIAVTIMAEYVSEIHTSFSGTDDLFKQLAHITRMQHRVQRRLDGDDE